MIAFVQRVIKAFVSINDNQISSIGNGLLILLGIYDDDTPKSVDKLCNKIIGLRIFNSETCSVDIKKIEGDILLVSQFTLCADTAKGNRPSYHRAASSDIAKEFYLLTTKTLSELLGRSIETGVFGADMKVHSINDGPMSIILQIS